MLNILVEGNMDKEIIYSIFLAAQIPVNKLKIVSLGGKNAIKRYIRENGAENSLVLIDSDKINIPDSKLEAMKQLDIPSGVEVFCAIPTIEAWIFADKDLLLKETTKIRGKESIKINNTLERIFMTDEIPYPKQLLATMIFKKSKDIDYRFLESMDIEKACLRSNSLRVFLKGVSTALGIDTDKHDEFLSRNISTDIFSNLIKEIMPSDTIVYKALDGTKFSALDMIPMC